MLLRLVRKGLIELISANFMMQFVGFGLLILLPRLVSEADIGHIRVLQSYTDLLIIVAGLGMNTAVLKLCSDRRPEAPPPALLRLAGVRTLQAGVVILLAVFVCVRWDLLPGDPVVLKWLPIYSLLVPFGAVTLVAAAYLQALRRIREMARAQVVVKIQSVVVILVATWLFGLPGFIYASVAAFAVGLWPFLRLIGTDFMGAARIRASAAFKDISLYSVLGNVLNTLGKYADIYVLGLFAPDPVQMGYYSLATIFVIPASVVTSSIQTIVTPYLSEGADDRAWFRRSLFRTQLQTVGVAVVVVLGVRMGAWVLVSTLYDPGYAAVLPYLDVLLIFHVLRSGYAVTATGHIALGLTRYNFVASGIMAVVALVLTYLALDRFGFDGVAWAKVITAALMILIYAALARRAIRIAPPSGAARDTTEPGSEIAP